MKTVWDFFPSERTFVQVSLHRLCVGIVADRSYVGLYLGPLSVVWTRKILVKVRS